MWGRRLSGVGGDAIRLCQGIMDTNFWVAVIVSFEAVRFFREKKPKGCGRMLIRLLSLTATTVIPLVGFYNTT
jgi:hypothetical protein